MIIYRTAYTRLC